MRQPIALLLPLFITFFIFCSLRGVVSDPQTYLLRRDCYQYDRYEYDANKSFNNSVSAALRDLRNQVANLGMSLATSEQWEPSNTSLPFYALFLCRNYLSVADCVACFTDAAAEILNCSAGTSFARIIYDGCFLRWSIQQRIGRAETCWRRSGLISCQRYEDTDFRDEPKGIGNPALCGEQTLEEATGFTSAAQQLLMNVQTTTPNVTGFQAAAKTQVPNNGPTIYAYAQCIQSLSQSECEICLMQGYNTMQTCLPGSNGRAYVDGCFMRYSTTRFFPDDQPIIITPLAIRGSSKKGTIIGAIVGGAAFVLILLALLAYIRRSKRRERVSNANGDIIGESSYLIGSPVNYSYGDLRFATKNFSVENKLGEGGFGVVYKGTLKNGKVVAVKKLTLCYSKRVEEEFESEVKLISNVHHRNLVQLLGCCSKGSERILVYEYMKNTSLDRFLFGQMKGSLDWKQRYNIILGTARGLSYLHEEFHVRIIHRDIKTNNILLDEDLQPKVSDFGLARLLPNEKSHLSTKVVGTFGYAAPEYVIHGQLSEKADIYSFGVVVLEIISGKRNNELKIDSDAEGEFLLLKAWRLYERGTHLELIDETLDPNDFDAEEVKKVIEIGLSCTQASAELRPTMSEVVLLLRNKGSSDNIKPTMPIFIEAN